MTAPHDPEDPATDEPGAGPDGVDEDGADEEPSRAQHDLAVANDSAPDGEREPPGLPAG